MDKIKKYAVAIILALLGSIDFVIGAVTEVATALHWPPSTAVVFRVCMGLLLVIVTKRPPNIKRPYNRKKQPPYVNKS